MIRLFLALPRCGSRNPALRAWQKPHRRADIHQSNARRCALQRHCNTAYTMADQLLDQVRDAFEGQIVWRTLSLS